MKRLLALTFAIIYCSLLIGQEKPSETPAALAADAAPSDQAELARGNRLAPKAFRAAVERIRPCMVLIEAFGGVSGAEKVSFKPGEGPTTGLILSADGLIATSTFHFTDRPPIITVVFADGTRKIAKALGRDDTRKLQLLKVDGVSNLPVPEHAPRSELRVGHWAIAGGFGFGGETPSISAGMISAVNRISGKAVQTDANLSPANYGGPLVDIEGRLIGMNVPLSPGGRDTAAGAEWYDSGIGFAVPLSEIDSILASLKEGKRLQPGYLGVQARPKGTPPRGVFLTKVLKQSAGEKAGLRPQDEIRAINGTPVLDSAHMSIEIGRYYLGDKISLDVRRGEHSLTIELTLADMPPPEKPPEGKGPGKGPEGKK